MRGSLSKLLQLSAMPTSPCRSGKQQLDDGVLRPTSLYKKVTTRIISEQEVRQIDPEGLSFINLNTPDALRRWRMR